MVPLFLMFGCFKPDYTTVYPTKAATEIMVSKTVLVKVSCIDGSGWGSGVILTDGDILTAAHVVEDSFLPLHSRT